MHVDDGTRLKHIREAALEAQEMVRDATREDLDADRKLPATVTEAPTLISPLLAEMLKVAAVPVVMIIPAASALTVRFPPEIVHSS